MMAASQVPPPLPRDPPLHALVPKGIALCAPSCKALQLLLQETKRAPGTAAQILWSWRFPGATRRKCTWWAGTAPAAPGAAGNGTGDYRQQLEQLRRVLWDNALTFVRRRGGADSENSGGTIPHPAAAAH